jgi:hypothetical protein
MLTVKDAFPLVSDHQRKGESKTMKIKILRNTVAGGKAVLEGDVLELSEQEAKYLVAIKKAEVYVPIPEVGTFGEAGEMEFGEGGMIETADLPRHETAMKPRGKRKS